MWIYQRVVSHSYPIRSLQIPLNHYQIPLNHYKIPLNHYKIPLNHHFANCESFPGRVSPRSSGSVGSMRSPSWTTWAKAWKMWKPVAFHHGKWCITQLIGFHGKNYRKIPYFMGNPWFLVDFPLSQPIESLSNNQWFSWLTESVPMIQRFGSYHGLTCFSSKYVSQSCVLEWYEDHH